MRLDWFFKRSGRRLLNEVSNHPCVTFLSREHCVFQGSIDPLQPDEVDYLRSKYNVKDFRFNNGVNTFTQQYFIASLSEVVVEPEHCIAIKGFSAVVKESIFYEWYKVSRKKYLKSSLLCLWRTKKIKSAIVFDGTVGLNYFHFVNDILTKLFLVREMFAGEQIPLIITNRLFYSSLFQFYYQFATIRNNNWMVLGDNEYLKVRELFIIKAKQFDVAALAKISRMVIESLEMLLTSPTPYRRIFINRKRKSGRYISNFGQLEPILERLGFRSVYLEDLQMMEQISVLRNAELLVGIHGAGLTNLIFANKDKVQVIEILPINFIPTHYYWLCNSLSINYKSFFGGDLLQNQGFEIDTARFDEVISTYTGKER